MGRKEKLERLFEIVSPIEVDLDVPENPCRFVALEQDDCGRTLNLYMDNHLEGLKDLIATSETRFVEDVRVHDLDADVVFVPIWKVQRFVVIEDDFSYEQGYATIP